MDDAQRAEKRRLGGKSSKSDGLKLRRNNNRSWFPIIWFLNHIMIFHYMVYNNMVSQSYNDIPFYGLQ